MKKVVFTTAIICMLSNLVFGQEVNDSEVQPQIVTDNLKLEIISVVEPRSNRNDGGFTVRISGGQPPYLLQIEKSDSEQARVDSLNSETLRTFTKLSSGSYSITVKDGIDRMSNQNLELNNRGELSYTVERPDITCPAKQNYYKIKVTQRRANVEYRIEVQHEGRTVYSSTITDSLINIPLKDLGKYTFILSDNQNFEKTLEYEYRPLDCLLHLDYNATHTDLDSDNGKIKLRVLDGTPPYSYSINNDTLNHTTSQQIMLENLKEGKYSIQIKDAENRGFSNTYIIGIDPVSINQYEQEYKNKKDSIIPKIEECKGCISNCRFYSKQPSCSDF